MLKPGSSLGTLTPFLPSGPLSELHYPIDSLTKKPKGFAFVTFMFPEHAVKAYAEVDGQVFQVMARGLAGDWWAQVVGGGCECVHMCMCRHGRAPQLVGTHTRCL